MVVARQELLRTITVAGEATRMCNVTWEDQMQEEVLHGITILPHGVTQVAHVKALAGIPILVEEVPGEILTTEDLTIQAASVVEAEVVEALAEVRVTLPEVLHADVTRNSKLF